MVLSITLFRLSSISQELVHAKEQLKAADAQKYKSTLSLQDDDDSADASSKKQN